VGSSGTERSRSKQSRYSEDTDTDRDRDRNRDRGLTCDANFLDRAEFLEYVFKLPLLRVVRDVTYEKLGHFVVCTGGC